MSKGKSRKPKHEVMPASGGRREQLANGYEINLLRHHYPSLGLFQYYVRVSSPFALIVEQSRVVESTSDADQIFDSMVEKYRNERDPRLCHELEPAQSTPEPEQFVIDDPKTALLQTIRIIQRQWINAMKQERLDRAEMLAKKEMAARDQLAKLLAKPVAA
ncbi:hypothetical protein [Herpetosiphon geysericola]|uniref:Uncharacterized protein n=1 Tax=Herpetosiphon geysericola TaxID=70996 RepID=A0A0P6Y0C9_9CHLR|nr:hypothetical protein [Herpetosiphon geysericola]KPL90779.1 hypothetical protein SE18_05275 [Herpetosiphon geysericola]